MCLSGVVSADDFFCRQGSIIVVFFLLFLGLFRAFFAALFWACATNGLINDLSSRHEPAGNAALAGHSATLGPPHVRYRSHQHESPAPYATAVRFGLIHKIKTQFTARSAHPSFLLLLAGSMPLIERVASLIPTTAIAADIRIT